MVFVLGHRFPKQPIKCTILSCHRVVVTAKVLAVHSAAVHHSATRARPISTNHRINNNQRQHFIQRLSKATIHDLY